MRTEKQKKFLIQAAYYMLIAALLYGGLKYIAPILLPFILAFIIVWSLRKPSVWLARQLHLPQKATALLLLIVFYVAAFALVLGAGSQLLSALRVWAPKLPALYTNQLLPALNQISDFAEQAISKFDPAFVTSIEQLFQQATLTLDQTITNASGVLMQTASNFIFAMPSFFVKALVMVVSSFFLSNDYHRVTQFCSKHLPDKYRTSVQNIIAKLKGSLLVYMRAYSILLLITFVELLGGLLLLNIPYAPIVACAIALFDLLPILGTGGILIPWVVIAAVLGYYPMAVGVALLYLVITVVRNTLEPKLIGKQIGLHPLVTLVSLFVGGQLFGIVGLFGLPVALSVLVQLRRQPEPTHRPDCVSTEVQP